MRIFLIIFDSLRKDHTGRIYLNNWIKTPNFDAFAKDSYVFDKAYPESLPTIPVRRAIHTGIRTFPFTDQQPELRTDDLVEAPGWTPIPPHHIHIGEYLRKYAHTTLFITSTYHQFKPNMNFHLGFDEWHFIRGHEFDKYKARMRGNKSENANYLNKHVVNKNKYNRSLIGIQKKLLKKYFANIQEREREEDFFPARTFKQAEKSVKDIKELKNFFCLIDEFDPHEPWDPPRKYVELYLNKKYNGNNIIQPLYAENLDYISKEELHCMRANYAGEVSLCDTWFGYFINKLKEMEIYDDSLIILLSDHGHCLGEHEVIGKIPRAMYPELVDIPLIIKPPEKINGPKRIEKSYVYTHDILPTIYGFLEKEQEPNFEGIDLSFFSRNNDQLLDNRDYITCGMAMWTLYKDDHYAFITSNDKTDQKLFDVKKDPNWNTSIAESNREICENLFKKIQEDAKRNLLLTFHSTRFNTFKDWYHTTYLI